MGSRKRKPRAQQHSDRIALEIAAHVLAAMTNRKWLPRWLWSGEKRTFNRLDADASGYLTVEDLAAAIERLPAAELLTLDVDARALGRGLFKPLPFRFAWLFTTVLVGWGGFMIVLLNGWRGALASESIRTAAGIVIACIGALMLLQAEGWRRRGRLVARLAAPAAALGNRGKPLSAAIVMLLDVPATSFGPYVPPLIAGITPAGDGQLDANEWGATSLPETATALAAALDRLDANGRASVASALDTAFFWNRTIVFLDGGSYLAGVLAFAVGLASLQMAGSFQAVAVGVLVAIALALLTLALAIATRRGAVAVRRRLAADVRSQLKG